MNEYAFTSMVIDLCRDNDLMVHHVTDSRYTQGSAGFPDLVIMGKYNILFAELKLEQGELSSGQKKWAYGLIALAGDPSPVNYEIWTPADLESGKIARVLSWT